MNFCKAGCAVLLALGMTITMTGPVFADTSPKEVRVGVFTTAVPFSYVKDGEYTGISNDILKRIAELENLKLDYMPLKFDALIPSVQAKQIDIAVSGIYVTEKRKKVVDFSDPYYIQGVVVVVPVNSGIKSIADLKGKTLAAEQGSAALESATANKANWGVTIRVLQDAANMQLAMRTGDVDAMIYDSGIMAYQIKQQKDNPTIRQVGDVINPTDIAFAFEKGSDLIPVINSGLKKLKESGELTNIVSTYKMN